jgi:hypothetical protein
VRRNRDLVFTIDDLPARYIHTYIHKVHKILRSLRNHSLVMITNTTTYCVCMSTKS